MATAEERARIAAALTEARKARGLSQASLALLVGVTKGCVGNWEAATASPAPDVEPRLLEVLAINAQQLRGLEPLPAIETHRHEKRRRWHQHDF